MRAPTGRFERRLSLPWSHIFNGRRRHRFTAWWSPPDRAVELNELQGFRPRFLTLERFVEGVFPAPDEVVDAVVGDEHGSIIADGRSGRTGAPVAGVATGAPVRCPGICEKIARDAHH